MRINLKIQIQELWFDKSDLTEGTFENETKRMEHISRYGEDYCRYIEMVTENKQRSISIPTFFFDAKGEVISSRKEKEIHSVEPKFEWIMKMVSDMIVRNEVYSEDDRIMKSVWGVEPKKIDRKDKKIYVYICYRNDLPNSVGICSHHEKLYNKKEAL